MTGDLVTSGHHMGKQGQPRPPRDNGPDTDMCADGLWLARRLCVRLAHVYCGQTAGWTKMPLGTEINVSPGDVVLDRVTGPPKRGTAPSFRFMSLVAKWMDR